MDMDVAPDILTTAKGLGGGFPVGGMLTTDLVARSFVIGTHGSTFGGNPLAASVALEVLSIVDDPAFLGEVVRKAGLLRTRLLAIGEASGAWSEVRGKGLWMGAVLSGEWEGRSKDIAGAGFDAGVMVLRAGANVVRTAPALNIPDEDLEEGLTRLEAAVHSLA
jgi:acetylornithine/N-succinyldiaminopimelate aminotransferase